VCYLNKFPYKTRSNVNKNRLQLYLHSVGYVEDIHKAAQTAKTHTHTKNCVTEHISSKHDREIIKSENNEPIRLLLIFLTT